jgi:hypothetical protein
VVIKLGVRSEKQASAIYSDMDLTLQEYNAVTGEATYSLNGVSALDMRNQLDRVNTPLAYGWHDGRVCGQLTKVDIDQRNNRATAVVKIADADTARMVSTGCLSALSLPPQPDRSPYLTDVQMPPSACFRYVKSPSEPVLTKSFKPSPTSILRKERQQALQKLVPVARPLDSLAQWRQGRVLRELQDQAHMAPRVNKNAIIIHGSEAAADRAARIAKTLVDTARDAAHERRQNANKALIER